MTSAAPTAANTAQGSTPESRRWLVLVLVLIPVFIGALDLTIVSAILPEVLAKLNIPIDANLDTAAWAITGYLLAYTLSMTIMGRFSDLIGRRGVYLVCLAIFIFGSYWVATAHEWPTAMFNQFARQVLKQRPDLSELTLYAVIIGRVIQALGAGAMVPVSMALAGDLFPPERRAQPIGLIGAVDTLGWVLGHLYGGLMVSTFNRNGPAIQQWLRQMGLNWPAPDWHTLFYVNVPVGIVALVLTWWALRGIKHPASKGRFDIIGALLISAAMIGANLAIGGRTEFSGSTSFNVLEDQAKASPLNVQVLLGALVCFLLFLLWEWRMRYPLIELHLFRKRNVLAASSTNLLIGFCLMLGLVSVPLMVNIRAEDTSLNSLAAAAEKSGILLSFLTVPMAIAAIPGGWLTSRLGYRITTATGMALATIGFLIAGTTWTGETPEAIMGLHMVIVGIGLGLTISPIATAVINDADESQRGVASALVIILRLIGMTVATSSMTSFALTRVSDLIKVAQASFPIGSTPEQIQSLALHAYFNSAVRVIGELLLIGAAACLLGLIPALLLRGKGVPEATPEATEPQPLSKPVSSQGR